MGQVLPDWHVLLIDEIWVGQFEFYFLQHFQVIWAKLPLHIHLKWIQIVIGQLPSYQLLPILKCIRTYFVRSICLSSLPIEDGPLLYLLEVLVFEAMENSLFHWCLGLSELFIYDLLNDGLFGSIQLGPQEATDLFHQVDDGDGSFLHHFQHVLSFNLLHQWFFIGLLCHLCLQLFQYVVLLILITPLLWLLLVGK